MLVEVLIAQLNTSMRVEHRIFCFFLSLVETSKDAVNVIHLARKR